MIKKFFVFLLVAAFLVGFSTIQSWARPNPHAPYIPIDADGPYVCDQPLVIEPDPADLGEPPVDPIVLTPEQEEELLRVCDGFLYQCFPSYRLIRNACTPPVR